MIDQIEYRRIVNVSYNLCYLETYSRIYTTASQRTGCDDIIGELDC